MRLFILLLFFAPTIIFFQNCGKSGIIDAPSGASVSCTPSDKPCLKYLVKLGNLKSTKGAMSVLVQGDVNEGVASDTIFSKSCSQINGSTAYCPFDTTVSATLRSDSTTTTVKGDGRTITVRVATSSDISSRSFGTRSNKVLASNHSEKETSDLCFVGDENRPLYDGDVVPLSDFSPCSDFE